MMEDCTHENTSIVNVTMIAGYLGEQRKVCDDCGLVLSVVEFTFDDSTQQWSRSTEPINKG